VVDDLDDSQVVGDFQVLEQFQWFAHVPVMLRQPAIVNVE
jgi:hypothetical protein